MIDVFTVLGGLSENFLDKAHSNVDGDAVLGYTGLCVLLSD
jgi:hypothetical protein